MQTRIRIHMSHIVLLFQCLIGFSAHSALPRTMPFRWPRPITATQPSAAHGPVATPPPTNSTTPQDDAALYADYELRRKYFGRPPYCQGTALPSHLRSIQWPQSWPKVIRLLSGNIGLYTWNAVRNRLDFVAHLSKNTLIAIDPNLLIDPVSYEGVGGYTTPSYFSPGRWNARVEVICLGPDNKSAVDLHTQTVGWLFVYVGEVEKNSSPVNVR